MQPSMKKPIALLIIIAILMCIIHIVDKIGLRKQQQKEGNKQEQIKTCGVPLPQANSTPNPDAPPFIKAMPNVPADINYTITAFPDLDRQRLERENLTLLPANEIIQSSYKDWNVGNSGNSGTNKNNVEKELYSSDAPLFTNRANKLVPLDVNGGQRRVNFY